MKHGEQNHYILCCESGGVCISFFFPRSCSSEIASAWKAIKWITAKYFKMPPIMLPLKTPDCLFFIVLRRITPKLWGGAKRHLNSISNYSRLSWWTTENGHLNFLRSPSCTKAAVFHRLYFQCHQFVQAPLMARWLITPALSVSIVILKLLIWP